MSHLNHYLKLKSSADLQPLFSTSNNPVKEITESMGAWKTMYPKFIDHKWTGLNIHIGDGSHCRTAALFAFNSASHNWTIDPLVNEKHMREWAHDKKAQRIWWSKSKFEDVIWSALMPGLTDPYNIILVHAHVDIRKVIAKFPNWIHIYSNPCCMRTEQTLSLQYQKENDIEVVMYGVDTGIISDKNEVVVYKNRRLLKSNQSL